MITHNVIQGTQEWEELRRNYFPASDAPAMLGVSTNKTRSKLLEEYATGINPEVTAETQARFDRGHRIEALARPWIEEEIGEDLYPVVGTEGRYLASFDGITMDEETVWECKTLNKSILECNHVIPEQYRVQMEHQLMVSGARRALFSGATENRDDLISFWYHSDADLRQRIIAGWTQFEKDVAAWTPEDDPVDNKVVTGIAPENLPALRVEVTGMVTSSNLEEFKRHALAIFDSINTALETDEDFATAEKVVKWCGDVEDRLSATKKNILAQTASIDEVFRTIDMVNGKSSEVRLMLTKLIKSEKESRKTALVMQAQVDYNKHVAELNAELVRVTIQEQRPDFGASIKGLKTIASIKDKLNGALAQSKISASNHAADYRAKLAWLKTLEAGNESLWFDLQNIIVKPLDDFKLLIESRIEAKAKSEKPEAANAASAAAVATISEIVTAPVADKPVETPFIAGSSDIAAFLKTRDFGKEEHRIRAVLVEFVKFCSLTNGM